MKNMNTFDVKTLRAKGGPCDGDYFGLPWPCYGTPELKHPGLAEPLRHVAHVMDGGGCFRANFGVERDGVNLLAEDGSYPKGGDLTIGYPEFDHVLMKKLGWWDELTEAEKKAAEGKNWKTDLSGGIIRVCDEEPRLPSVRQREGARRRVELPRRRPAASRAAVLAAAGHGREVPDARRQEGVLAAADAVQVGAGEERRERVAKKFPLILTSGRLVEYEGGGEETRCNPWLAELQQENFVEINPKDANDRGVRDGEYVWVQSPTGAQIKVKAHGDRARRRGHDVHPVPLRGLVEGKDMLEFYPEGAAPIVRGEAVNTATTYGYDSVTMMQETKTTLCQVAKVRA